MKVGVVREVKPHEHRVALTPAGAHALVGAGHEVFVEVGAGEGSQLDDDGYAAAGATLLPAAADVWGVADLVVKVKEPQPGEFAHLRPDLTIFTYLHLAAYPDVAAALVRSGCTAIAYETVRELDGSLPLLAPMSEIAGRMAAQVGARFLERYQGGRGVLLGGATGVAPSRVVVVGAGVAGVNAAAMASGLGADVTVFDISLPRLRELERIERGRLRTRMSNPFELAEAAAGADLVIGAVLLPGARAPMVLDRRAVAAMRPGAVIVDISIDQGGCFETSHETTHSEPAYEVDGVVHYCVGNIPGAVPRTSTLALTNVTLPYVVAVAGLGSDLAVQRSPALAEGLNVRRGELVNAAVREAVAA